SLTLLLTLCLPLVSQGKTIEICGSCGVKTLKEAIAMASPHDTLIIQKGVYREFDITIDKPLTLIGKGMPTIDGEDKGGIINIVSDDVTVDGLHRIRVGSSYTTDHAAVRVIRSKNFKLVNLLLEEPFFAIYLERASDGLVANNRIIGDAVEEYNSGNGIQLWY